MDAQDIGGFEGDQTGMGQGLAYVLPQSRTVGYFMQLANEKAQQRRDDAAALAEKQQKRNELYAQDLYNTKTPDVASEYSKYMQPKFTSYLDDAAAYNAKTGDDAFRTPAFVQRRNDLISEANDTQEQHKAVTALATQIADKSKNYTPESKRAGMEYVNAYFNDPVGNFRKPPPTLVERDLDLNDAVKLGHATANVRSAGGYTITEPNTHNHVVQGQAILSQPEFSPYLEQNGINSKVGDSFGQPNGHGGTIYPTDTPTVNAIADHIIQNASQPHFAATLQAAGIDPADPHAKDKLTELVQRQNAGYGKVLGEFRDRLNANIETKKVPDYNPERIEQGWQRIFDAQQRQANKPANQPTYFQDLSERMRTGVAGSGEELNDQLRGNPAYLHKASYDLTDPKAVKINVPAKYKYDPKQVKLDEQGKPIPNSGRVIEKPAYTVTLDSTDPQQWTSAFAPVYRDITGDQTATETKAMTPYGKGHVPGGQAAATGAKVNPVNTHKKAASDYGL